jgi:hypothetical protein
MITEVLSVTFGIQLDMNKIKQTYKARIAEISA